MKSIVARLLLAALFVIVAGVRPAAADSFVSLPEIGGKNAKLKLRVVRYDGSTNGKMIVEVKNTSKKTEKFVADRLYFIPGVEADKAPQRLGAAGPFVEVTQSGDSQHLNEIAVGPGQTKQLALEVFCIDSHRSSPSSETSFTLAKKPLPKALGQEINGKARKIMQDNKGDFAASKDAIQSETWKSRDKKWIKLEGESAQEANK